MTLQIGLTLAVLIAAVILFITEKIRMDLVALLVLIGLALLSLVTPAEALAGFSNPAVVTVWAVFILSAGLSRTGVANLVGKQIIRLAGSGEVGLITMIMLTSAVMSAFMNNVGVAALLLPVVVSIARRTGRHPSRLLMPLAVGSLLGGMMTLIGTPPNILASDALRDAGFGPLQLFDFFPVGGAATVAGILFMILIGRHLLPTPEGEAADAGKSQEEIEAAYLMRERLSRIRIPSDSPLAGRQLSESRLSAALGLTVLDVSRPGDPGILPQPGTELKGGDVLTVAGRLDSLDEVRGRNYLEIMSDNLTVADLITEEISLADIRVVEGAEVIGRNLKQLGFRQNYGAIVLSVRREDKALRTSFDSISLRAGDVLLIQGHRSGIEALRALPDFAVREETDARGYRLDETLLEVRIPEDSPLVGKPLSESRLAELTGLAVLGLVRDGERRFMVDPRTTILQADDRLFVKGHAQANLEALRALQDLQIETDESPTLRDLETDQTGMLEVVLSPHSRYPGRTLGQIEFRGRYDLNVIAIFREGRAYRTNVGSLTLRFGDALLLHGRREKLALLAKDTNFISLADDVQPSPRIDKAPLAVLIMLAMIGTVLFGWLPISIAAVTAGVLMVLTGCLTMDEAYREIEWRAVFLIAGMLPLGTAMASTGTAAMLADVVVGSLGALGTLPMIAGLFLLTLVASQIMPNPVVMVLMAPIALSTAANLGISPYAIIIVIAFGASASFLSPVGHPANLLIMAPGGYRFKDYLRVGLPLSFVMLLIALLVLPIFWPLSAP